MLKLSIIHYLVFENSKDFRQTPKFQEDEIPRDPKIPRLLQIIPVKGIRPSNHPTTLSLKKAKGRTKISFNYHE